MKKHKLSYKQVISKMCIYRLSKMLDSFNVNYKWTKIK